MNILLIFACLILPIAFVIGMHNLIAHFMIPRIMRSQASRSLYFMSAFIGVPIHELSHAFFAVLFRHKIDKMCLFQRESSGRLGYVQHCWNTRSLYQVVGLFFIAIAPLFGAGLVIVLSRYSFNIPIDGFHYASQATNIVDLVRVIYSNMTVLIHSAISQWHAFVWLIVMSLISFHCIPSRTDFNHALKGSFIVLAVISLLLLVLDILNFQSASNVIFAVWSISVTMLSLVFVSSILWWGILLLFSFIPRR